MRYAQIYNTAIGDICIVQEDEAVIGLGIAGKLKPENVIWKETPLLRQAIVQLTEYFAGERRNFTVRLHTAGTAFQEKIWGLLQEIPYGETRTYGELAAMAGSPKGARAVGMACNRNPVMLFIPCHRVIGSDGSLTGFGGGLPVKKKLLELEKNA